MSKINLSIPKPCHENWYTMSPQDKGRFCSSCQKNVIDFTKASDREIAVAFRKNQNLCGRFLDTQLNRDLVKTNPKSNVWLATTSAIISFIGLGSDETLAQQKVKTEQIESEIVGKPAAPKDISITGRVYDDEMMPMEGVLVTVKNKNGVTYTDKDGKFIIHIRENDILLFSKKEYRSEKEQYAFDSDRGHFSVYMLTTKKVAKPLSTTTIILGGAVNGIEIEAKKRTFIGRTFHSIGELFR